MTSPATKQKIAILGGGIGALTAAFELTEQDPDGSRYDITIYTLGWRLGGKAASRRDPDRHCRAYEHGLHVWAGFYDNAFDLVQRLYARIEKDEDAWGRFFEPLNHFTVAEYIDGDWKPWVLTAQPNEFAPGLDVAPDLGPFTLLFGVLSGLTTLLNFDVVPDTSRREIQAATEKAIAEVFPGRRLGDGESALTVLREFTEMRRQDPSRFTAEDARMLIEAARFEAAAALNHEKNPDAARRLGILYDLGFALAEGLLSDEVIVGGLDAIDDHEWSKWMSDNGCPEETLKSALVRGCYDYVFAFGADGRPNIGAGTATTALLRFLFTYKGSIFYALRETMGDFLFAPLYDYLSGERGVKFEFFCKIRSLTLAKDRPVLEEIVFDRQVLLADGVNTYDPLVDMPSVGRRTWPYGPKTSEIEDGDDLEGYDLESAWTDWPDVAPGRRLRLRSADDGEPYDDIFDIAILATSFGGLNATCADLKARLPAWRKCLDGVQAIPTMSLQLWLYPDTEHLGWPDPQTVLTAFEKPGDVPPQFDSWEDNTRLLRLEAPRDDDPQPRSLAYFAGEFPLAKDEPPRPYPEFPEQQDQLVRQIAVDWMNARLPGLWRNAAAGTGFDWELLEAPRDASGQERLASQYWRANINPWDRYVLSAPRTLDYRLPPDESGVENLYLAGDWVRSGLNAGCIEAAVIAGRMVARAITGANIMVPGNGIPNDLPLPISALPVVNTLRKVKEHTAGGVGLMEGYFTTVTLPGDWVAKLLPPGLELMKTELDDKGYRPIVFLLTRQRNVRPGFVPFGGIHYQEFIEIIPRVRRKGLHSPAGGPFCYMPYLVLDEMLAVMLGVNLYGFNKRFGRISSSAGSFDIHSDLGQARSWFTPSGLPGDRGDISGVDTICKLVEHPYVSQRSTGDWVFSHFDLCLDTAEFQQINGYLKVAPAFIGSDKPITFGRPPKDHSPLWFRFSSHWTLSVPLNLHRSSRPVVSQDLQDFAARLSARGRPRGFFFP
jgi:uncharacterized protein with NAD-binding domain and iron-sulfur cluster